MRRLLRECALAGLALCVSVNVYGGETRPASRPAAGKADAKAQKVLARMEKLAESTTSYRCSMNWRVESKWFKPKTKKGKMVMLKVPLVKGEPGRRVALLKYVQTVPFRRELYVTRDRALEYLPDNKIAKYVPVDRGKETSAGAGQQAFAALVAPKRLTENFNITYVKSGQLDGDMCDVLRIVPAGTGVKSEYKDIELWVSRKRNLPVFMVGVKDDGETTHKVKFLDIGLNPKIKESEFVFKPPRGVHVESVSEIRL